MSLESKIDELIAALNANTAAHKGGPVAVATPTAAATGKTTTKAPPKAPEISLDALKAAGVKVKDAHGQPFTKKIIEEHGKAKGLTEVKTENYAALMQAFEEALAAPKEEAPESDDEL